VSVVCRVSALFSLSAYELATSSLFSSLLDQDDLLGWASYAYLAFYRGGCKIPRGASLEW
jgi:hypothetical protein